MNPILSQLADNPALFEAVKARLLSEFDLDDIWAMETAQDLGEVVKARLTGRLLITRVFDDIARLKTTPTKAPEPNPAR